MSIPRATAATMLFAGGVLVSITAFALAVAKVVVDQGAFPVTVKDAQLIADLAAVAPFVAVFGLTNVVAGFGVALQAPWGRSTGTAVAGLGAVLGAGALTLLFLGRDPFASLGSDRALEGIQAVGSFTVYFTAIVIVIAVDRVTGRVRSAAAAAA